MLNYLNNKHLYLLSDLPLQLPDIHIIKNIWSILKLKIHKRCPKTEEELWEVIKVINFNPLTKLTFSSNVHNIFKIHIASKL